MTAQLSNAEPRPAQVSLSTWERAGMMAALALTMAALGTAPVQAQQPAPQTHPPERIVPAVQSVTPILAPTGTLRAAINFGNPVLAQRAPDGTPGGVSVALATELARRLGVPLVIIPYTQAGKVTEALAADTSPNGPWDICFLAKDPVRGQGIAFTDPYVLIQGVYAVPDNARQTTPEAIDEPGTAIAVVQGSAYDLFLSRALKHATLVRYAANAQAFEAFLAGRQPVLAGVKQPLAALVAEHPGHHLIPGGFMSIEQTMGTPNTRDPSGAAVLARFIAEMKATGFVQSALNASNQPDAEVPSD